MAPHARLIISVIQLGLALNCLPSDLTVATPAQKPTQSAERVDCENSETGWKIEKLNGKVKSLREEKIEYGYGDHKKELTRLITFKPNGDYIRDDWREYYQLRDYAKVVKTAFVFDKNCRIVERRDPKQPWLIKEATRAVFSYSPSGTLTEEAVYDNEGRLQWKSDAILDKNERIIETNNTIQEHPEHFNPKRYDVYRHTKSFFKLDETGNQIEEIAYNWQGNLYATYKFAHDSNRRLIRTLRLDEKNRPIDLSIYKFDAAGLLLEELKYTSAEYGSIKENDLIPGTLDSGYGMFQEGDRISFEYDKANNWIKKTEFDLKKGGKLESVTYRTITYY